MPHACCFRLRLIVRRWNDVRANLAMIEKVGTPNRVKHNQPGLFATILLYVSKWWRFSARRIFFTPEWGQQDCDTVDGSEIQANQLRLVVYPTIYIYLQGLYRCQVVVWDFWTINSKKNVLASWDGVQHFKSTEAALMANRMPHSYFEYDMHMKTIWYNLWIWIWIWVLNTTLNMVSAYEYDKYDDK